MLYVLCVNYKGGSINHCTLKEFHKSAQNNLDMKSLCDMYLSTYVENAENMQFLI